MHYLMALRVQSTLKWLIYVTGGLYVLIVGVAASQGVFAVPPPPVHSGDCPLPALFAAASLAASICATILACALCQANDGHLPVAWTLPISRTTAAMKTFATGALGVLAAFAITLFAIFVFIATFRALPAVTWTPDSGEQLVRFLLFPFAIYGLTTAISASLGRHGSALAGWSWLAYLISGVWANLNLPQPWHAIFLAINLFDPLRYASYSTASGAVQVMTMPGTPVQVELGIDIAALAALALAGYVGGLLQWNRLEA